jgi:ABC-type amino acid transport substrate-binding protein
MVGAIVQMKQKISVFLALTLLLVVTGRVWAAEEVVTIVLRENSEGSSAQAQPYLDRLLALLAKKNGWKQARGTYMTRREVALDFIKKERPQLGILSLGAFVALKNSHRLKVIGQVDLAAQGGRQYFLVSKHASTLDQCKGQTLASNHLDDTKFVEAVIAAKAFFLADFKPVFTRRPIQTIKEVIRDQAECALIDDAQLFASKQVEGGAALKVVWQSRKLPPMPVVAFPSANSQLVGQFQKSLSALCTGEGAELCKNVGITSLKKASDSAYTELSSAFAK